jgi:hypothetical protein
VRVKTARGEDWFLAGGGGLETPPAVRGIGPFETDAALAAVRIAGGRAVHVMFRGGTTLRFEHGGVRLRRQGMAREQTYQWADGP